MTKHHRAYVNCFKSGTTSVKLLAIAICANKDLRLNTEGRKYEFTRHTQVFVKLRQL